MATTYLSRTGIGSSNNQKKWTFSGWFKKSLNGSEQRIITSSDNSSYDDCLRWRSNDKVSVVFNNVHVLQTNRVCRDNNAWYHIVLKVDTDQASANDRIVLYVNGLDQRTNGGYTTDSMPNQGTTGYINYAQHYIGVTNPSANSHHFNGIMSHVHFTDGYAYTSTSFGETDSTTGEWKIKTSPSVSYGTTGFWILKDGNSVTDSSPNSNTFTVSAGTLTKTEDCPSNVFCTVNPLARYAANLNITNGNTTLDENGDNWQMASSTLGASTGKWYLEYKIQTAGYQNGYHKIGFISDQAFANNTGHIAESALDGGYAFYCQNGSLEVRTNDAVISGYSQSDLGVNLTAGSVMCLAIDMDNKRAYFRKNADAWIKSANPVNGTNGLDISADYTTGKAMIPAVAIFKGGAGSINFGNGYFGQSAVSSAGTNASNNGIFEYDVPTGYTALSTKGLNL